MEEEQKFQEGAAVALKFPKRRIKNGQTHNYEDFDESLDFVVEEMGKLNEHNFSGVMKAELQLTDMAAGVCFKGYGNSVYIDVSGNLVGTAGVSVVKQNSLWTAIHPAVLSKTANSSDGGHFRLVAGAQYTVQDTNPNSTSYTLFAFRVDGAVLPDSVIGDQDFFSSDEHMEIGMSGAHDSFLLDLTVYLSPGAHTIEVVGQTRNLVGTRRELAAPGAAPEDLYIFTAECFYWELFR